MGKLCCSHFYVQLWLDPSSELTYRFASIANAVFVFAKTETQIEFWICAGFHWDDFGYCMAWGKEEFK